MESTGLVSVAVGNTSTRAALWLDGNTAGGCGPSEGRLLCSAETAELRSPEGAARFASVLRQYLQLTGSGDKEQEDRVRLAAVVIGGGSVPAVEEELFKALTVAGPPFADVRLMNRHQHEGEGDTEDDQHRDRIVKELGIRVMPSPPWRVGKDRLCAALGALALETESTTDTAWVVVDSGTALTINAVLPSPESAWPEVGVFEGGLIIPGEGLMLRSLSSGTAQLPSLTYWPPSPPPLIGKSTDEAIRAGVRHLHLKGAVAVVKSVASDLVQRRISTDADDSRPWRVRVAVTGGGGKGLVEALAEEAEEYRPLYDPLLVHRGLRMAWQLQRRGDDETKPKPSTNKS